MDRSRFLGSSVHFIRYRDYVVEEDKHCSLTTNCSDARAQNIDHVYERKTATALNCRHLENELKLVICNIR